MASGTLTISAQSVDASSGSGASCYPGITSGCCYGDCNPQLYARGINTATITLNFNVDSSGTFSISYGGCTYNHPYTWSICSVKYGLAIDWSTDGTNWTTIMLSESWNFPCSGGLTPVADVAQALCAGLTPVQLTQSGYARARMYANAACPECGFPDAWSSAFPNDAASVATAVPVHIDVSWTATVKYDANGGTGAPGNTTGTSTANSQTLTLSNTSPTRTNYKFLGWATSSSATTAAYQPGGSITVQKTSPTVQLYAVWEAPWTATLRYAGEGSGLPSAQTATVDANSNSHNFTVSSTIPTRSNYRFDGWATVGGGAVAYHGGDTYTIQKSSPSKYLYAVWTAYWTATVHYDANGGTGAPADQTASVNPDYNTKTFTVSSTVPTRTNYRFEGWSYGGNTYHGGDTITVSSSSATVNLVAIWTEFYRPGERKVSGTWRSHNRSGGACERKVSGTWTEMRTIDGGTGTGDEPTRKSSGTWYNQRKLGAE